MAQLGFLGLGIMGYRMARNLLKAGHEVALWSHTASKARELAGCGNATVCATPREVAERADCMFIIVGDTAMSEAVTFGEHGLAEGLRPGAVVVDSSTVLPSYARKAAQLLSAKQVFFLDAPCTGSKGGAEGGTLMFMVGGDKEAFERVRPYFEPLGKLLYYCGGAGMGLLAKLAQNLFQANVLQAFNEGIVLSTKAGIDPDLMLEILNNSAARSGLIAFKAPFIFERDFSTKFSTKWMHKDVGLALEAARELGVPVPLTSLTYQMNQAALAMGLGEEDFCSLIKVLEAIVGIEVKKINKI